MRWTMVGKMNEMDNGISEVIKITARENQMN